MVTQHSIADKRRVYLAWRTVFAGPSALFRRPKKVREVVEANQHKFQPLIRDLGFEHVSDILISLLNDRIFESELKAKIAFPELFRTTPSRDVQHAESQNDAVRSEAEALEDLLSADEADEEIGEDKGRDHSEYGEEAKPESAKALSLYPLYLPYKAQHVILTTIQGQLERCCFEFVAKWLPAILEDNKWDCPEAVELNLWTRTLVKRCDKIPAIALHNDSNTILEDIFTSTNAIRHTAVHRLPTSAREILKMVETAARLAKTLGDQPRATQLKGLHAEVESRLRDLEINKNFLENRLDEQLRVISQKRAELDREERDALAATLKEDQENKLLIGSFLEASCRDAFDFNGPMQDSMQDSMLAARALLTDSDENNDNSHRLITEAGARSDY